MAKAFYSAPSIMMGLQELYLIVGCTNNNMKKTYWNVYQFIILVSLYSRVMATSTSLRLANPVALLHNNPNDPVPHM